MIKKNIQNIYCGIMIWCSVGLQAMEDTQLHETKSRNVPGKIVALYALPSTEHFITQQEPYKQSSCFRPYHVFDSQCSYKSAAEWHANSIATHPTAHFVAALTDNDVALIDGSAFNIQYWKLPETEKRRGICFSQEGDNLFMVVQTNNMDSDRVDIWNIEQEKVSSSVWTSKQAVSSLLIHNMHMCLITIPGFEGGKSLIGLHDIRAPRQEVEYYKIPGKSIEIQSNPTDQNEFAVNTNTGLYFFDVRRKDSQLEFKHKSQFPYPLKIAKFIYHPNGEKLFISCYDGSIYVANTNFSVLKNIFSTHPAPLAYPICFMSQATTGADVLAIASSYKQDKSVKSSITVLQKLLAE